MTFSEITTLLVIINLAVSIVIQIINTLILREIFQYIRHSNRDSHDKLNYLIGKLDRIVTQGGARNAE